jgi:pre-rRNA-processing protein TSR3
LEGRSDMQFFTYPKDPLPSLAEAVMLDLDGPQLSPEDGGRPLLIVDATWRWAGVMVRQLPTVEKRSLPGGYRTAYPRKQEDCVDPERGLASVEALYIAYCLLGRDPAGLLDNYYWKDKFLKINDFH